MNQLTEPEIAWLAGIYEGEGSCGIKGGAITVSFVSTDHDIVERFYKLIGAGYIHGPRENRGYKPITSFNCGGQAAVELLNTIMPWLGFRRKQRAKEAVMVWTTKRKQTRASDTHCVHNHELTPENVFPTYGGKGRGCRICREAATKKYRDKRRARDGIGWNSRPYVRKTPRITIPMRTIRSEEDNRTPKYARNRTAVWVYFDCGSPTTRGHVLSRKGDLLSISLDHSIELTDADGGGWCCEVDRDVSEVEALSPFRRLI